MCISLPVGILIDIEMHAIYDFFIFIDSTFVM